MKVVLGIVAVIVVLGLIVGGAYISARNQMVTLNEQVRSDWAQVDVVLQRRADLIPNLVATVKGIAAQEVTVFSDIANARAALLGAQTPHDKIAANGQLDGALGRLLAISENYPQLRSNEENYPQLRSNENFLRLQDELAGTENRIAVERKRYDDDLQAYNTFILQFPNHVFAGWAGFKRNDDYFAASPAAQVVPKVEFAPPQK
jgi:LemA protein